VLRARHRLVVAAADVERLDQEVDVVPVVAVRVQHVGLQVAELVLSRPPLNASTASSMRSLCA
jgi:hypothetical protein